MNIDSANEHSKKRSPFRLNGDIKLTLHTRLSQSLLDGRWQYGHLGLWQFALKIRDLWEGHRADDPYADWYFMKIYEKIHSIHKEIHELENYYQQKLSEFRGFYIHIFENPYPRELSLKFANPFSYLSASLLPEFDYISRQAYTLRHIGKLLESKNLPIKIAFNIRQLFSIPMGWKRMATREDMRVNNVLAQEAIKKMGVMPAEVLSKEIKLLLL